MPKKIKNSVNLFAEIKALRRELAELSSKAGFSATVQSYQGNAPSAATRTAPKRVGPASRSKAQRDRKPKKKVSAGHTTSSVTPMPNDVKNLQYAPVYELKESAPVGFYDAEQAPRGGFGPLASKELMFSRLFERVRIDWLTGNTASLASLSLPLIEGEPEKHLLAAIHATALLSQGDVARAREAIYQAIAWGLEPAACANFFIAGAHRHLAAAYASGCNDNKFQQHLRLAGAHPSPNAPGVPTDAQKGPRPVTQPAERGVSPLSRLRRDSNTADATFDSASYWEHRYSRGGNSGCGSYGRLAQFKANTINKFISDHNVSSLIDFGCGDGHQLGLLKVRHYVGVDVSPTAIRACQQLYSQDTNKSFLTAADYSLRQLQADLTLSLDVIFHLVEDDAFRDYMNTLIKASRHYCIVYSSNNALLSDQAVHVRHRDFVQWMKQHAPGWRIKQIIFNEYPTVHGGAADASFSDFYFFERTSPPQA